MTVTDALALGQVALYVLFMVRIFNTARELNAEKEDMPFWISLFLLWILATTILTGILFLLLWEWQ